MILTIEGQTEESELTRILFRKRSDTVWDMCDPGGSDCVTATLVSPDKAKIQPADPDQSIMALTRRNAPAGKQ
jgi:hypothetical protein